MWEETEGGMLDSSFLFVSITHFPCPITCIKLGHVFFFIPASCGYPMLKLDIWALGTWNGMHVPHSEYRQHSALKFGTNIVAWGLRRMN